MGSKNNKVIAKKNLSNPPIRELVIDIRTIVPEEFKPKKFKAIHKSIGKSYPFIEERHKVEGHIGFGPNADKQLPLSPTFVGYVFKSKSEKNLVQFRSDGFTINKIKPYSGWGTELKKAMKFWPEYVRIAKPQKISRIAVRAINDVVFDLKEHSLDELFVIAPKFPRTKSPLQVPNFFHRTGFVDPESDIRATLLHTFEGKMDKTKINFVLDIDVYREQEVAVDDPSLWEQFEQLNNLKDELFFNCLTAKGLELFR